MFLNLRRVGPHVFKPHVFTVINITSVSNKKNKNKNEKLEIHGGLN